MEHEYSQYLTNDRRKTFEQLGYDLVLSRVANAEYTLETRYAATAWLHEQNKHKDNVSKSTHIAAWISVILTIVGIVLPICFK